MEDDIAQRSREGVAIILRVAGTRRFAIPWFIAIVSLQSQDFFLLARVPVIPQYMTIYSYVPTFLYVEGVHIYVYPLAPRWKAEKLLERIFPHMSRGANAHTAGKNLPNIYKHTPCSGKSTRWANLKLTGLLRPGKQYLRMALRTPPASSLLSVHISGSQQNEAKGVRE